MYLFPRFQFCAVLGVRNPNLDLLTGTHLNESASGSTFVSRVFRRVFSSLLPIVLVHLCHSGEFRFTLVQSVVWSLLGRQDEHVKCDVQQQES